MEKRDPVCRAATKVFQIPCSGWREWAHIGPYRRFNTRHQPPERRHTTGGTAMLCHGHHEAYDRHRFDIEFLTDRECDGPLAFVSGEVRVEEPWP